MKIISSGRTDPGKKRKNNEDAFLLDDGLRLYAVADGIGGHEAGEVASRIIIETLTELAPGLLIGDDSTPPFSLSQDVEPRMSALRYAITLSNKKIFEMSASNPSLSGMGSTATVLHLWQDKAYIAHVGDSRAYLLRAGTLRQITSDHSLVAEQMRAGKLTTDQAKKSAYRHIITRAVGIDREVIVEHSTLTTRQNDTFLLCTDGLTEMVDDAEMSRVLLNSSPAAAADALIRSANEHGGVDNIAVVVVRME